MKPVTIYSTPTCPYCIRAKQLFTSLNVAFTDVDLSADPALAEELNNKHNWRTVPMIFIGDEFVGGYDDVIALQARGELMSKLEG